MLTVKRQLFADLEKWFAIPNYEEILLDFYWNTLSTFKVYFVGYITGKVLIALRKQGTDVPISGNAPVSSNKQDASCSPKLVHRKLCKCHVRGVSTRKVQVAGMIMMCVWVSGIIDTQLLWALVLHQFALG